MGFFDSILNIGKRILGIGSGGTAAAGARVAARTGQVVRAGAGRGAAAAAGRVGRALGGAAALGGAFAVGESIFSPDQAAVAGMGGNGQTFRRTIVLTIRSDDGVIVRRKVLEGSPHIMNKDIQIAKRVFRASTKLGARLPKKTIRRSRRSMLTDQVMENALERASCPTPVQALACPPRC